LFIGR